MEREGDIEKCSRAEICVKKEREGKRKKEGEGEEKREKGGKGESLQKGL